ncbi:hypothetical protein GV054_00100 [Marinomonas mediterranea]|uniref:hypothetical protein n=1 Tax=Marinomonas mediterranea TaxID=119864 RepID=UPI00234AD669|nr:hypothetical protein [Marinomonas mediterranea]WCN11523.1 hypothetical protein GV054_00100 [Marinomonas mediterranea]
MYQTLRKNSELNSFEKQLKEWMDDGGWLKELGAYRDLVMHSAPINIANHRLYGIQEIISLADSKQAQSVRFPIPSNPDGLYKQRCKKTDFDKYVKELELIAKAALDDFGKYDCLEYAQTISTKLSNLALETGSLAPYKPMIQQFIRTSKGTISSFREA